MQKIIVQLKLIEKRITELYEKHILTRPTIKNVSVTSVALGLGIIEVAGIDAQKQVRIYLDQLY